MKRVRITVRLSVAVNDRTGITCVYVREGNGRTNEHAKWAVASMTGRERVATREQTIRIMIWIELLNWIGIGR